MQEIRKETVEVDYYRAGGNIHVAKVVLVPRGLPYPHALNAYCSAGTIIIDFDGIASEAVMPENYLTPDCLVRRDRETLMEMAHLSAVNRPYGGTIVPAAFLKDSRVLSINALLDSLATFESARDQD